MLNQPKNETDKETQVNIRVLLVEDHALTRMGLKAALKRTTDIVVVGEASNGEEGVALAEKLKPDVILMDVGMPIMDGIQAAREVTAINPAVKVIMLTQHDNDQDVLASLSAGASGYCLKDVEPERLYTAIRSVNAGDAWLDSAIASRVLKHYSNEQVPAKIEKSAPVAEQAHISQPSQSAQPMDRPLVEPLSPRELEVLALIVDGLSNQEIADKLFISLATAKTHVRNILNKLAVDDRTQAAVHAMRRGLV
jgi:DNA-binding NarL/FixJ family response regulator